MPWKESKHKYRKLGTSSVDEPTGWALQLSRASGSSTLTWGSFVTVEDAVDWAYEHKLLGAVYIPMYLDVDWTR